MGTIFRLLNVWEESCFSHPSFFSAFGTLVDALYSENAEAAETFAERIGEIVDNSDNLSDDELRDALCDPYDLVYDIITDRAW